MLTAPFRLLPIFRERVWGRRNLAPYFPNIPSRERIGEAWFTFEENSTSLGPAFGDVIREHPAILGEARDSSYAGICPLLLKMLFTSERLSVQVHPDDEYARRHHACLGKTEAWYVVHAEPPAELAVGFREWLTPARLRAAALSGEIEGLLDWRTVKPGDVIYTPAGTVHAIGAGLTICEIQQHSDITYRLYDYGRARELHLDHGVKVAHLGPHEEEMKPASLAPGREQLAASPYFRLERLRVANLLKIAANQPVYLILLCLSGQGTIGGETFGPGQCWFIPAGRDAVLLDGPESEWILTYTAAEALDGITPGAAKL